PVMGPLKSLPVTSSDPRIGKVSTQGNMSNIYVSERYYEVTLDSAASRLRTLGGCELVIFLPQFSKCWDYRNENGWL
ncbi:mCG144638, partial [Mus musculus]